MSERVRHNSQSVPRVAELTAAGAPVRRAVVLGAGQSAAEAVGRDHRVAVGPDVAAGIHLQGGTEHTRGLTSTLLSTTAVRAGEIRDSLVARLTHR